MNGIPEMLMSEDALSVNHFIGTGKKCTKCHQAKDNIDFYPGKYKKDGLASWCKECSHTINREYTLRNKGSRREYGKQWRLLNKEKVKEANISWRLEHKEYLKEYLLQWHLSNKGKSRIYSLKQLGTQKRKDQMVQWRKNNPDKMKVYAKKSQKKVESTVRGRLGKRMSHYIWKALKGMKGNRHWELLVGYTLEMLMQHIERKFNTGMTWGNYGRHGWHIDHIIPISVFNFEKPEDVDFKKCWALSNLQPLWEADNIRKYNHLTKPFQPSLTLEV
jgi:5-methylcytosine-specific restriction endonuclease McrA